MSVQRSSGIDVGAMRGGLTYKADDWQEAMDDGMAMFSTAQAQLQVFADCPETLSNASSVEVSSILHGTLYLLEVSSGLLDSAFKGAIEAGAKAG